MIVKKSTIIAVSAISVLLMWGAYQYGVNYGRSRANNRSRAVQKSNRSYPMQNREKGTERLKTVNLGGEG